jgi:hypothetical protein
MIHNTEHNSSGVIVEQNDRKQSLPAALQPLKTNIPLGVNRQPTSSVGNPQVLLATHKFCYSRKSGVAIFIRCQTQCQTQCIPPSTLGRLHNDHNASLMDPEGLVAALSTCGQNW